MHVKPVHTLSDDELEAEEHRLYAAARNLGELRSTPERRLLWRKLMDRGELCAIERRKRRRLRYGVASRPFDAA